MTTDPTAAGDSGQARFLTGEAVHLDVRIARVGSRVLARLIDLVVQVVLAQVVTLAISILLVLAGSAGVVELDGALTGITIIITEVVTFVGYPVVLETLTRGRTMGKLVLGLRVVRDDGGPIAFRQALVRGLVGTAIEFPGIIGAPITWVVTLWTMIVNPQSKRIGDQVAGTVVIHERTPAAWGWAPTMPPGLAIWASTLDLAGLDDDLALAVRQFLARNRQIREPARSQLGQRLAQEVAAVTNPPPPAQTPGWAYLAAVHAERHRRAVRQLHVVRSRAAAIWPDLATAMAIPSPPGALVAPYRTPPGSSPTPPAPPVPASPVPASPVPASPVPASPAPAEPAAVIPEPAGSGSGLTLRPPAPPA